MSLMQQVDLALREAGRVELADTFGAHLQKLVDHTHKLMKLHQMATLTAKRYINHIQRECAHRWRIMRLPGDIPTAYIPNHIVCKNCGWQIEDDPAARFVVRCEQGDLNHYGDRKSGVALPRQHVERLAAMGIYRPKEIDDDQERVRDHSEGVGSEPTQSGEPSGS